MKFELVGFQGFLSWWSLPGFSYTAFLLDPPDVKRGNIFVNESILLLVSICPPVEARPDKCKNPDLLETNSYRVGSLGYVFRIEKCSFFYGCMHMSADLTHYGVAPVFYWRCSSDF